jgi:hypothetical protein
MNEQEKHALVDYSHGSMTALELRRRLGGANLRRGPALAKRGKIKWPVRPRVM